MASESTPPVSFSASRRWGIFFSVVLSIVAMIALVGMANYLGARYYTRFSWNSQMEIKPASQTVFLLKSITNQVKVIIYYDTTDNLYSYVSAWLDEFRLTNPKISVQTVDYKRQPALAQQIKVAYKLGTVEDKNVVIFDCGGRVKTVPAAVLGDYTYEQVPNDKQPEWASHLKAFEGEKQFSSALLSVLNTKLRKAYFLIGHAEHDFGSTAETGYSKFADVFEKNNVTNEVLKLSGTNIIPADCNLLVIPGPTQVFSEEELSKIKQYLDQGGRLFVLFNSSTEHKRTGLESILADWNVDVGMNVIADPDNQTPGGALIVGNWNNTHPLSAPMLNSRATLNMIQPRSIQVLNTLKQGPETPRVVELAYTGPNPTVGHAAIAFGRAAPLMVAVEKGNTKGVFTERGTTAILAVGDSTFLENYPIQFADNLDFVGYAVNWLMDQTEMLQGVAPHNIKEFQLTMTDSQINHVGWLLLAVIPGGILAFGCLVWFRRRH